MKLFLKDTVLEAAKARVSRLFDEFEHVYVASSGGKDSTVVLHLALAEAEKRGRLPLPVIFVDQEAEWLSTIEHMREIMTDPRVKPVWLQCPIKISNSASMEDVWLYCWQEGSEWMRDKEDYSIHENIFHHDRFKTMFDFVLYHYHPAEKACLIGGVRAEESPGRRHSLTSSPKYQDITWGKKFKAAGVAEHYAFYPLYDWSYTDVWKYIHDSGHSYCKIYDLMYQHGVPTRDMRVSNLHHETAVRSLYYMQEVEQETWNALTKRLGGVHGARNLSFKEMFQAPKKVPWMFKSWVEYRDYLLEKLIALPAHQELYRKAFVRYDADYGGMVNPSRLWKVQIATLLANDFHLTKLDNFGATPQAGEYVKFKRGRPIKAKYAQWVQPEDLANATLNEVN